MNNIPSPRHPQISVIIPMGSPCTHLPDIHRQVFRNPDIQKELIIIAPRRHTEHWRPHITDKEQWIFSDREGRGCFLYEGVQQARGDILLFLHADTVLPVDWDVRVCTALASDRVTGGGFSLQFDRPHAYLRILIRLSDLFYLMRKELWGDRALFVRTEVLRSHMRYIDVPLMEDVALSRIIRGAGKMCLLKEKVTTSARHFYQRGFIRHTAIILFCRLMYALGVREQKLFDWYYSQGSRPIDTPAEQASEWSMR